MKAKWTKPILYEEKFELDQHIAAGCTTQTEITVTPHGSISFSEECDPNQYHGNGHWHYTGKITDSDGDGKISKDEWESAMNYVAHTGIGHRNHAKVVIINGKNYAQGDFEGLFTS